jgi:dienelactone hydrolase
MVRLTMVLLALTGSLTAAEPVKQPLPLPGLEMIQNYFVKQTKEIADSDLSDFKSKEDWEKARPELKRQLHEMLGLYPMPARTELKPVITGKIDTPKYTIEKLYFQSRPNLFVIANLYIPKPAPKNAPTILYVCGHGNVVKDGVSYGSKVHYQHHPAWFAEHGYVAMVIDTLQLSEIPGLHHGTYRLGMWWWHNLGYTPAGVECWNGMRALDYLETRPEVDPKRIGVTGRSGGGAYSWWLAAADERIACAIPVAGIADLQAHLNEGYPGRLAKGVIAGHCDCMFMVNTYRWDFSKVAAMIAPRPVLLGNSDVDDIFPIPGYRRIAEKVRKIYGFYGAGEKFDLLETKGAHEDTPELRIGAYRWMNRWLKNSTEMVTEEPFQKRDPKDLKVFNKIPEGEINTTIQETFIQPTTINLPQSPEVAREWWTGQKEQMQKAIQEKVFRNWPKATALNLKPAGDKTHDGVRLRAWDFESQEGIPLRLWLMSAGEAKPSLVVLNLLDEPGWKEWCSDLGNEFAEVLQVKEPISRDDAKFKQNKAVMEKQHWAFAAVCPRGIGPTKWAEPGSSDDIQYRRRFALIGQTLDSMRVWDARRAFQALQSLPEVKEAPLWLQGKDQMAAISLYASLYEPGIARLDLWRLPTAHRNGPFFLNVSKYLDIPQALALAHPRPIKLYLEREEEKQAFRWPLELQKGLGKESLQIRVVGK